jgi:hypothetical protein
MYELALSRLLRKLALRDKYKLFVGKSIKIDWVPVFVPSKISVFGSGLGGSVFFVVPSMDPKSNNLLI